MLYLTQRFNGTEPTADILRYSITLDTVEKVSSLIAVTSGGLALRASDSKSIYYFEGYTVQKFNMETNITVELPAYLPSPVHSAGGVSTNGTIFIFNGPYRVVLEFNEELEKAEVIGDFLFQNGTFFHSTTAIPNGQEGVWLFGGTSECEFESGGGKPTNLILYFNTTSKTMSIPNGNFTSLPTLCETPAPVFDGHNGFLIGGLGREWESDGSYRPINGLLK
jgi:hypothetical protein